MFLRFCVPIDKTTRIAKANMVDSSTVTQPKKTGVLSFVGDRPSLMDKKPSIPEVVAASTTGILTEIRTEPGRKSVYFILNIS